MRFIRPDARTTSRDRGVVAPPVVAKKSFALIEDDGLYGFEATYACGHTVSVYPHWETPAQAEEAARWRLKATLCDCSSGQPRMRAAVEQARTSRGKEEQ